MSWINGFTTVSNTGTWLEFFSQVKQTIAERTNFSIIDGDDYSFIIDFGNGFTCKISDYVITSESITSNSNSLKLENYQNGVLRNSVNLSYGSTSTSQTTLITRTLNFFTFCNENLEILGIANYSAASNVSLSSTSFIKCKSKDIATNTEKQIFKVYNTSAYDADGNAFTLSNEISSASSGIVILNALLLQSSKIVAYLPDIYNCSTVTPYRYYLINNQKYYAIDTNLLVKAWYRDKFYNYK